MTDDPIQLLPEPLDDAELDAIESAAMALIDAINAQDFDGAYIISATCANPAMLAMFVAELTRTDQDVAA